MDRKQEKNSSTQGARSTPSSRAARRLATLALLAGVAVTTACGMIKVGYRNADTVGLFWINRYVDLNGDQEAFFKPRLHAVLAWHRKTQLTDYADFAAQLQQRALRPITGAEVENVAEQAQRRGMAAVDHVLPDLADLALRFDASNLKALQKKFAADDATWRGDFMKGDADRQLRARYEKTLDRVEEWYGRFDGEQRKRIRQLSDARPFDNAILLAERQRRQRELLALLTKVVDEKTPRDGVVAQMKAYADRFDRNPDPERRAFLEALRKATFEMDAGIHNLATDEQRRRAVVKLQEWIDDFRSLAAEPV